MSPAKEKQKNDVRPTCEMLDTGYKTPQVKSTFISIFYKKGKVKTFRTTIQLKENNQELVEKSN